jgi:hypothetical protein
MSRDGPPHGNPRRRPAHSGRHRPSPLAAALSPGSAPAAPARRSGAAQGAQALRAELLEGPKRHLQGEPAAAPSPSDCIEAAANGSGRSALARNARLVSDGRTPGVKRRGQATIGEVVCRQRHRNARCGRRRTRRGWRPSAELHGRSSGAQARRPGPTARSRPRTISAASRRSRRSKHRAEAARGPARRWLPPAGPATACAGASETSPRSCAARARRAAGRKAAAVGHHPPAEPQADRLHDVR